ncbi:MAG: germination protein YpeB [Oscillospiraceae bacterium]|nr:germination protein YpeB [Oscillospiraceae bacterium]
MTNISRRALVRLISFSALAISASAATLLLSGEPDPDRAEHENLSYIQSNRTILAERITPAQAIVFAQRKLEKLEITETTVLHHEIQDKICVIFFAGVEDGLINYDNLIKTRVAMDTGEVLSIKHLR